MGSTKQYYSDLRQEFYELSAQTVTGELFSFSSLVGKVVLIVNTASHCGFTSQYRGMQTLHEKYFTHGLVVLGFPSNDFAGQEPGTDEEIKQFCTLTYKVSFPLFSKAPVRGGHKQAVYRCLTERSAPQFQGEVGWNFVKFLVSRSGEVIGRFSSITRPTGKRLIREIEGALFD